MSCLHTLIPITFTVLPPCCLAQLLFGQLMGNLGKFHSYTVVGDWEKAGDITENTIICKNVDSMLVVTVTGLLAH